MGNSINLSQTWARSSGDFLDDEATIAGRGERENDSEDRVDEDKVERIDDVGEWARKGVSEGEREGSPDTLVLVRRLDTSILGL